MNNKKKKAQNYKVREKNIENLNTYKKIILLAKKCKEKYGIYPISFSHNGIGYKDIINKRKNFATCVPGNLETYIFKNMKDYYNDYFISKFAYTQKKSGWDCNRHLEIMFNNALVLFKDIHKCPKYTMIHYPKKLFIEINEKKEDILKDNKLFEKYLKRQTSHFMRHLTCKKMIEYMFKVTGKKIKGNEKILFLDSSLSLLRDDYCSAFLLIGLKLKFKNNVDVLFPYNKIYKNENIKYDNSYGMGFGYTNILEQSYKSDIEKNNPFIRKIKKKFCRKRKGKNIKKYSDISNLNLQDVKTYILNKEYDYVFYGSIGRCDVFSSFINEKYKERVYAVNGKDNIPILTSKNYAFYYFKREI